MLDVRALSTRETPRREAACLGSLQSDCSRIVVNDRVGAIEVLEGGRGLLPAMREAALVLVGSAPGDTPR